MKIILLCYVKHSYMCNHCIVGQPGIPGSSYQKPTVYPTPSYPGSPGKWIIMFKLKNTYHFNMLKLATKN